MESLFALEYLFVPVIQKSVVPVAQMPVVQNASNTPVVQAAVEAATKSVIVGENDLPPAYEIESKNQMRK